MKKQQNKHTKKTKHTHTKTEEKNRKKEEGIFSRSFK